MASPGQLRVKILALFLAGVVVLSLAAPASAHTRAELALEPAAQVTAQPSPVLATIDAALPAHLGALANYQTGYAVSRGRYWQQLESHAEPPAEGALVAPDRLSSR